jgi:hypothetical protein
LSDIAKTVRGEGQTSDVDDTAFKKSLASNLMTMMNSLSEKENEHNNATILLPENWRSMDYEVE